MTGAESLDTGRASGCRQHTMSIGKQEMFHGLLDLKVILDQEDIELSDRFRGIRPSSTIPRYAPALRRPGDRHGCPLIRLAVDLYSSPPSVDDAIDNREAKPCSTLPLRGHERLQAV